MLKCKLLWGAGKEREGSSESGTQGGQEQTGNPGCWILEVGREGTTFFSLLYLTVELGSGDLTHCRGTRRFDLGSLKCLPLWHCAEPSSVGLEVAIYFPKTGIVLSICTSVVPSIVNCKFLLDVWRVGWISPEFTSLEGFSCPSISCPIPVRCLQPPYANYSLDQEAESMCLSFSPNLPVSFHKVGAVIGTAQSFLGRTLGAHLSKEKHFVLFNFSVMVLLAKLGMWSPCRSTRERKFGVGSPIIAMHLWQTRKSEWS